MPRRFNSSFTMFVYLSGHSLLEHYFQLFDTLTAANDVSSDARRDSVDFAR